MKSKIGQLHAARKNKNDEFYTQLADIEKEMVHYTNHFRDKIIFCNCDNPTESNFWNYFAVNFEFLGLKKLIATHYESNIPSYKLELVKTANHKINKIDTITTPLKQHGDFRSPECIEILEEVDIVITNPPFSLFREFVAQLIEYNKKFIILGHLNGIDYKEIFPLFKKNKIWLGKSIHSGDREFRVPKHYPLTAINNRIDAQGYGYVKVAGVRWFVNIDYDKRHENLILNKTYNEIDYPFYDNYNVININKVRDIPSNYDYEMGVPITFLDKYNPEQFEIVDLGLVYTKRISGKSEHFKINGIKKYTRIIIKHIGSKMKIKRKEVPTY